MRGRVLIIAGSDSGGGAGIQADIKTVTALGSYAATAITALTAQNTQGVFGIHDVPTEFVAKQITLVLEDIGADIIKTGMLNSSKMVKAVAETINKHASDIPLVVDPVMVAKGGKPLLEKDAIEILRDIMVPMSDIITPNIPEAELLTGIKISSEKDMIKSGEKLINMGAKSAMIKGGHLAGENLKDILIRNGEIKTWGYKKIKTRHTHGTGCTLASAIATYMAQNVEIEQAVEQAREYVMKAIKTAPGFGKGHGPLNHACMAKIYGV